MSIAESTILKVLGDESFAAFIGVRIPGIVVWFNFELARKAGFEIPESNIMTPELHSRVLHMFSVRALRKGEELRDREPVLLYADKYGGRDISPCLGAGRAGFIVQGNFYLKGIGHTPLYRPSSSDDFQHTHGGLSIRESMFEAVFGEVNATLLTKGSARILAIIDQGDYTIYPDGRKEPRAVAVRAGLQLRPAHLFVKEVEGTGQTFSLFLRIVSSTGQLVLRETGGSRGSVPDLKSTMLRIIEDHAVTSAELFRWRLLHGAISMSNMEMSGAMLDTTTQSAQPRTAPVKILTYHSDANIIYGKEQLQRADELRLMYRRILRSIPREQKAMVNAKPLDFTVEMERAFEKHLQFQLLKAVGLKTEVARSVQTEHPEIARRLKNVLLEMATLRNPGSVNANKMPIDNIAVLNVFNLLKEYPALYFTNPSADTKREIRRYLAPVLGGNRSHWTKKLSIVAKLIREFRAVYADLMTACEFLVPHHYENLADMRQSIISRAAFENRPLSFLYRWNILREFRQAGDSYRLTNDIGTISGLISGRIAASCRNVDSLLYRDSVRISGKGPIELQKRVIGGISYSVLAWNNKKQVRQLRIAVPLSRFGRAYAVQIENPKVLRAREVNTLVYHYTTDEWKTSSIVQGRFERNGQNPVVAFYLSAHLAQVGELCGTCRSGSGDETVLQNDASGYPTYAYALPSRKELSVLIERTNYEQLPNSAPEISKAH